MKKFAVMILSAALLLSSALPCRAASLPAKYDLRTQGRVTGVKDQGSERTFCWAFATLASLESNLITQGIAGPDIDLSEAHLACYMLNPKSSESADKYAGKDAYFHSGDATNFYTAAAVLARGYGAVSEKTMPYSLYDGGNSPGGKYFSEKMMTKSQYELKQAVFVQVNNTTKKYDQAAYTRIKQLIMKNGAVASKIYFPGFYDWKTVFGTTNPNQIKTYYCSVKTPSGRYFIPFELQDVAEKGARPAVIQSGQSYIQLGGSWQGITVQSKIAAGEDTYRLYNALVKGFGTKAGKTAQKISAKSSLEMKKGAKLSLNAVRTSGTGKRLICINKSTTPLNRYRSKALYLLKRCYSFSAEHHPERSSLRHSKHSLL